VTAIAKRGAFFKAEGKLVYGWALVCEERGADGEFAPYVDTQGDHIPEDAMVEAAIEFAKNSRTGLDMHAGSPAGSVPLVYVITRGSAMLGIESTKTGMLIGWEPNDPELLKAIAAGERTGFSIGGEVLESDHDLAKFAKAADGEPTASKPRVFRRFRIDEISLVDRPAMEGATIAYVKRDARISTHAPATNKVSTMTPAEYEAKIAELEAKLAEMTPADKAEGDAPAKPTVEQLLARIAELEAAEAAREVEMSAKPADELAKSADGAYTCDDGTVIAKGADPLIVKYAQAADAANRALKAEHLARELVDLKKRAGETLGHLGGTLDLRASLLKAAESIGTAAVEVLKGADAAMASKAVAPGVGGEPAPRQAESVADYESLVTKRMSDASESREKAVAFVQSTPEFSRLYKAMSATTPTK
jgi:hypothetical protein